MKKARHIFINAAGFGKIPFHLFGGGAAGRQSEVGEGRGAVRRWGCAFLSCEKFNGFGKALSEKLHEEVNGAAALALAVAIPLVSSDRQAVVPLPAVFIPARSSCSPCAAKKKKQGRLGLPGLSVPVKNTLCVLLLSFLFVFLGLRPFRLLGSLHNVNALADILKLVNFGAGGFQLCISGFALRGKLGILFFYAAIGIDFTPSGSFTWR